MVTRLGMILVEGVVDIHYMYVYCSKRHADNGIAVTWGRKEGMANLAVHLLV